MKKIQKTAFEAAIKQEIKDLEELAKVASEIIKLSHAKTFNKLEDYTNECDENEIFMEIATIANKMVDNGIFAAIHLQYADFKFENQQVRAFLVLSNKQAGSENRTDFAHIELWYADSEKTLTYPTFKIGIMDIVPDWTIIKSCLNYDFIE